jgi:hypothetical protein
LLTHDLRTRPGFVYERVKAGLEVPGVIEVRQNIPLGELINELEWVIQAGQAEDFKNQVRYIPLG